MANRIFRIFNPDAPKQDPAEKRRGQLRRAQKTYRDRKDQYARALEKEIARARASEADALAQLARMRQTAAVLAGRLARHGLARPGDLDGLGLEEPASSHAHHHHHHHASPGQQLRDLDPVVAGMEFVLKIEEPCLDHLTADPANPHEVNGHALTVSAHLLAASVPPPPVPAHDTPGSGSTFSPASTFASASTTTTAFSPTPPPVSASPAAAAAATTTTALPPYDTAPAAVLERLLALAPALVPDGAVTPVQAWRYIRAQPHLGGCAAHRLAALAERLRAAATCHGFGAVVGMRTFEELVAETLI